MHEGDLIGRHFGNYRLVRLLGEGSFAQVYLGQHLHIATQAAIKVLATRLTDEEMERFRAEANTFAGLRHAHIVRMLDFGVEGRLPYIAMDYAPHGSVRQRHPAGTRLPLDTILRYVQQIASALQYAHDQHLIHRDLKPENLLLGQDDALLLADFGVSMEALSTYQQQTGPFSGTAAYAAPEQLQGKPRPASDQYALAVVVYEWLCGDRPFHGTSLEIASQQVLTPPPPLRERVPDLPPAVEEVVLTALAKDPKERFARVAAFARALEQAALPAEPWRATPGVLAPRSTLVPQPASQPEPPLAPPTAQGVGASVPPSQAIVRTETMKRRQGFPKRAAILVVGLVLLVVVGSVGFLYYTQNTQHHPYPPFGTLALNDTLSNNSQGHGWDEFPPNSIGGACQFSGGAYHVSASKAGYANFCLAAKNTFSNFAFEVQMRILQGDCGGVVFRFQPIGNGVFYAFLLCQNGTYALLKSYADTLRDTTSSTAIHTGLDQSNLLAVVANGPTFDLYVNNQMIDRISDSTYSQGEIGVEASYQSGPTEVVFSNAKVWT